MGELSDGKKEERCYLLISGDVGPYAAYLADGPEYNGAYGEITLEELKIFISPRFIFSWRRELTS